MVETREPSTPEEQAAFQAWWARTEAIGCSCMDPDAAECRDCCDTWVQPKCACHTEAP
jgi:hypothetical protein